MPEVTSFACCCNASDPEAAGAIAAAAAGSPMPTSCCGLKVGIVPAAPPAACCTVGVAAASPVAAAVVPGPSNEASGPLPANPYPPSAPRPPAAIGRSTCPALPPITVFLPSSAATASVADSLLLARPLAFPATVVVELAARLLGRAPELQI